MRMKPWFARGPLFALTVWMSVLMAAPASAQVDTGTILGTVKDQSGARASRRDGHDHSRRSGLHAHHRHARGRHLHLHADPHGRLPVETEFPGFKKGVRRGITVAIQEQAVVDFSLQPGGVAEEVVVTGESPLLQTGTGTVGETLKSGTLESMPVNGRDYTVLARLVTGVVPPQPGARAPLMFAANGVRPAQNNYLLDGIDNNTSNVDFLSGVAYIVKPPIDAVDEIKIMTSAFSAEYGRAGGAVLNTTLKSGSNQLRGTVWEFNRNDAMNANDFFANQRRAQERRVPVEPVRLHRRRPGRHQQDLLVRRLRGQPDQAGAHVGEDRTDRGRACQRLHRLFRPHLAADRNRRRRRSRPHRSRAARSSIRRRRVQRRLVSSIQSPAWPQRALASCAIRSLATASRRAGSTPTPFG